MGGTAPTAAPAAAQTSAPVDAPAHGPNPHLVGWGNVLVPGLGQDLLGNWGTGMLQAGYEIGSFGIGYSFSPDKGIASLDGIRETYRGFNRRDVNRGEVSVESEMYTDIFLEFSIKTHMANTFVAYRDAYKNLGVTDGIDQRTWSEGLMTPFKYNYFSDPRVYIPFGVIVAAVTADYIMERGSTTAIQPLTPYSNVLYAMNYGLWQPFGSGWSEEAFYRGFLQREMTLASGTPILGIAGQALAFAFSHASGGGRYAAGAAGLYLGYLTQVNGGDLGPGITLHFWSNLLLGVETILLHHDAQRTTPPAALSVQLNY